eukprot:264996-Chlamydomonas_euryale.AAC.2
MGPCDRRHEAPQRRPHQECPDCQPGIPGEDDTGLGASAPPRSSHPARRKRERGDGRRAK